MNLLTYDDIGDVTMNDWNQIASVWIGNDYYACATEGTTDLERLISSVQVFTCSFCDDVIAVNAFLASATNQLLMDEMELLELYILLATF